MAFKDFAVGEVLTSQDVDNFLMRQTVMVFDDASARTSALSAVLTEGMVTYLKDTNSTEVFDGASFVAISGGAGAVGFEATFLLMGA